MYRAAVWVRGGVIVQMVYTWKPDNWKKEKTWMKEHKVIFLETKGWWYEGIVHF